MFICLQIFFSKCLNWKLSFVDFYSLNHSRQSSGKWNIHKMLYVSAGLEKLYMLHDISFTMITGKHSENADLQQGVFTKLLYPKIIRSFPKILSLLPNVSGCTYIKYCHDESLITFEVMSARKTVSLKIH